MQILKQSTAVDVLIGPFVDITDGATSEAGETPVVELSKNGQGLAAKTDATVPVYDSLGYYNCELDATDTNTVGTLDLVVEASVTALPVRHRFQVVEEAVYVALFADSAPGYGTAQTGDSFARIGAAGAGLTAINLPNQTMDIVGNITGNLSGSVGSVTGHTAQTGDTYALANGATGFAAIDTVVDSILDDTDLIDDATSGLAKIATDVAAVLVDTGTTIPALLPAALVSGRMDCNLSAISDNTAALAAWLAALKTIETIVVGAGSTTTTVVTAAPANDTDDIYNGRLMAFYDSADTQFREYARITNYDAASNTFTVTTMSTTPISGDVVVII